MGSRVCFLGNCCHAAIGSENFVARTVQTGPPAPVFSEGVRHFLANKRLRYFSAAAEAAVGILALMRSRASRIIVALVLLTCLVCPLVEMFDHWDNTIRTGNDTEYALVILALCVGVAYLFARFVFRCSVVRFLTRTAHTSSVQNLFLSTPCSFTFLLFDATSPPPLPLRI
jgi:hypothetical protein